MSELIPNQEAGLEQVAALVASNECTLFLGAGPSIAAGGPSWDDLSRTLHAQFECTHPNPEEWWDVVEEAIDLHGQGAVYDGVRIALEGIPVPAWEQQLLALPWREIYTTNYDATFHRMSTLEAGERKLRIYSSGELPERDLTVTKPVYHLMGCMERRSGETGSMVLSKDDQVLRSQEFAPYFRRLKDAIDDGYPTIVVGHSLNDGVLRQAMKLTARAASTGQNGRVMVVTPHAPDARALRGMAQLDITHVQGTAEDLARVLAEVQFVGPIPGGRIIQFGTKGVQLSETTERLANTNGMLIDAREAGYEGIDKNKFYASSVYSREAFKENWDFVRDYLAITPDGKNVAGTETPLGVRQAITKAIGQSSVPIVLLQAGPGTAKTMSALRLLYEWTVQGGIGFYCDRNSHGGHGADFAYLVESTHGDIMTEYPGLQDSPPFLVVLDNCAATWHVVEDAGATLRRAGITNACILVLGRLNEAPQHAIQSIDLHYQLDQKITAAERERLVPFIQAATGRGVVDVADVLENTDSYWAVMWHLLDPTRPPLEEAIVQLFRTLQPWEKELVATAAVFSGLDTVLPWRCARRIPGQSVSMRDVIDAVDKGPSSNLVMRRIDGAFERLEFLNRTAAIQLVNREIKQTSGCASYLRETVKAAHPDDDEAKQVENSIISGLKRDTLRDPRRQGWINLDQKEALLRMAAEKFQTAILHQHHGMVLTTQQDFEAAYDELRRALEKSPNERQTNNIRHSFAKLCTDWGAFVLDGNPGEASRLLAEAKRHLDLMEHGDSYFYTAQAKWHLVSSREDHDRKIFHLSECIRQCKFGLAMERGVQRLELYEGIQNQAYEEMARSSFSNAEAEQLAREYRSGAGYMVLATRGIGPGGVAALSREDAEQALMLVGKALTISSKDDVARELQIRLIRRLRPLDADVLSKAISGLESPQLQCYGHLVLASAHIARGKLGPAQAEMKAAQGIDPGYVAPPDRTPDLFICNGDGPLRYAVKGHESDPYLDVMGLRIPVPRGQIGSQWLVRPTPGGLKPARLA